MKRPRDYRRFLALRGYRRLPVIRTEKHEGDVEIITRHTARAEPAC